jgi:hypothetical protein
MVFCVTEEMVADLLTKIVAGAQDNRLTLRFYNLCPAAWTYVTHTTRKTLVLRHGFV